MNTEDPDEKNENDGKNEIPTSHESHSSHSREAPVGGTKNGRDEKNGSNEIPTAPAPDSAPERVAPPRGDYRTLLSFQKAEVIYDFTFRFTKKHLKWGDRTVDQMVQAARSGKKNLLEGSKLGATTKKLELNLTNVARASLEELLDDYRDFLRARDFPIWDKDSKEARYVRELGRKTLLSYEEFREFMETRPAEVVANIAICLIHQTNYLIDQQLKTLDREFVEEGGLGERMYRVRSEHRKKPRFKN